MSWFLVIMICANDTAWSCSVTTIPKPYKTSEECSVRGAELRKLNLTWTHRCVGVPE